MDIITTINRIIYFMELKNEYLQKLEVPVAYFITKDGNDFYNYLVVNQFFADYVWKKIKDAIKHGANELGVTCPYCMIRDLLDSNEIEEVYSNYNYCNTCLYAKEHGICCENNNNTYSTIISYLYQVRYNEDEDEYDDDEFPNKEYKKILKKVEDTIK